MPVRVKGCQLWLWVCSVLAAEQGWWHGNDGTGVTKTSWGRKEVILTGWGASVLCVRLPSTLLPLHCLLWCCCSVQGMTFALRKAQGQGLDLGKAQL